MDKIFKDKRGVSEVIGYVLLITLGIVMAIVVYSYLKTYIPKDLLECSEGTSIFLKDYSCDQNQLNLTLKNNGKFNYAGYYLYFSNNSNIEVATNNLANNFINSTTDELAIRVLDSYVLFNLEDDNFMKPGIEVVHIFNISNLNVSLIELTPVKFESYNGKEKFAVCGKAKIRSEIICS